MSNFSDQFRLDFPEFTNTTTFPDAQIEFWNGVGIASLNEKRWGTLYSYGMELFVAHNIALSAINVRVANRGQIPIGAAGMVTNKNAGDVSVGYDTNNVKIEGAGNYNMTVYGRQFFQMVRILGVGGLQIPQNSDRLQG